VSDPTRQLAAFFKYAIDASWEGCGLDGGDIQNVAERLGLIRSVPYDPAKHGPSDEAEPDDPWFVLADDIAALLA
jgi:hypothetical protein